MRRWITIAYLSVFAVVASQAVRAETGKWDHAANVKDAATRLAVLHKREGSPGVLKFLDACYRTHMLASDFSKGLEACMAQDLMHSQVLATIYGRLPPGERARLNAPSPELIEKGMRQRFAAAFSQYRVAIAEVDEFKTLVDKHGLPVFLRAVFPKQAAPEASPGKSGADGKKKN